MYILLILLIIIVIILINYQKISSEYFFNNNYIYEKDNIFNTYDNFISSNECDILIKLSEGKFKKSTIVNKEDNVIDNNVRTSSSTFFTHHQNEIITKIQNQLCDILNINLNQFEPIQITKYNKGEEYKLHYDYFDKSSPQFNNQRIHTILVYLNDLDDNDGGQTYFPYFNKKFNPTKGKALHWQNVNDNGEGNTKTLHCSQPILTNQTKYILSIWIREKIY